jgi:alanine dehydrogenase
MIIGVPKEILAYENRVAMTPDWARTLHEAGHNVYVQAGAGTGSSFHDEAYRKAGAVILDTAEEVFKKSDIIVKVKQPLEQEYKLIEERHILFTYLHLASSKTLTDALTRTGAHCIAYETIEDRSGRLPLLKPMSEVAGRMSVQIGARFLERGVNDQHPGRGILLGGAAGVPPAIVTILGAGIVGRAALKIAVGMGAHVNVFDNNLNALSEIDDLYGSRVATIFSTSSAIEKRVLESDLVIGAVLITGNGSVIVDVAVDQGGCIETSEVTSHDNPIIVKHNVLHYGVANMPGAVPNTSTHALCNSTMPYLLKLANRGISALDEDPGFKKGLNIADGKLLIDI